MKANWEYKKLTDACSIQYGYPFDSSNFSTEAKGMPLIRIRDVKPGFSETYYFGSYPQEYIVHKGDFLIGMDGEFNIAPWKSEDALLNQRVCKITSKGDIAIEYVYRFLLKELKQIEDETPFVTVKHLSAKRLNQVVLPVPPLSEQKRIVAELDLLTGVIDKRRMQLTELDTLAQSIFYDMFGDPIHNEKGWAVKNLGILGDLARGVSKYRPRNAPELLGGTMPLIQTGDVANSDYKIRKYSSTYSELGVAQSRVWPKGTLCITIAATIGKSAILDFDACFPDSVVGFTPYEQVACDYILFIFRNMQKMLEEYAPGVAQKNINLAILNELKIPVPPLTLQQEFADKIQSIEKQKAAINQSIADTQKLLDYTMDKYFG